MEGSCLDARYLAAIDGLALARSPNFCSLDIEFEHIPLVHLSLRFPLRQITHGLAAPDKQSQCPKGLERTTNVHRPALVRNVIEYRNDGVGATLCCHCHRAGPRIR
jgi:hypothetical protein